MKKILIFFGVLFHWLWKLLTIGRLLLTNLVFFLLLFLVIAVFVHHPRVTVPDHCALLLEPAGDIVEKRSIINPLAEIIGEETGTPVYEETLLQDILDSISRAADDERISLLVLSPGKLRHAGLDQLLTIGRAIDEFKLTGKPVVAVGDAYSQAQYLLASHADNIFLHPMGLTEVRGFGVFRIYARDLLDKLDVNFHVFRVGAYKSAVEPLVRNSMSPEAREANLHWLRRLWRLYCDDVRQQRRLEEGAIDDLIDNVESRLRAVDGDMARLALDARLVTGLKSRAEMDDFLQGLVGRNGDEKGYNHIHFKDYLTTFTPSYTRGNDSLPQVGIIVAEGDIIHGRGAPGFIGSDSLSRTIRRVRQDKNIKALVLRLNTGGGSAVASEIIRDQLAQTRRSGKPVVVSMGSVAASGGYWIAADADQIWASPATLTGSIGIFGAIPTFEGTLSRLGLHGDGVGTTRLAAGINPGRPLAPEMEKSIQLSVENGYTRFLEVVARGRSMSVEEVRRIAGGRVWDGVSAMDLGLVDRLGSLDEAIRAAAELAGLDEYSPVYVTPALSSTEELLRKFGASVARLPAVVTEIFFRPFFGTGGNLLERMRSSLRLPLLNDPVHLHAHSLLAGELLGL